MKEKEMVEERQKREDKITNGEERTYEKTKTKERADNKDEGIQMFESITKSIQREQTRERKREITKKRVKKRADKQERNNDAYRKQKHREDK